MGNPLISIIIPTFNRLSYLTETLTSFLNQEYDNWECIIVDDGSTDKTKDYLLELIELDSRFKFFKRPSTLPKGANSCRNFGFEKAKGEYINWFDDDDYALPNFLSDKIKNLNSELNFLISMGYRADSELKIKDKIVVNVKTNVLYKDFVLNGLEILTPSVLFRYNWLKDKELFDTSIYKGQEYDFFSRLFFTTNENDFLIIKSFGFLYRSHQNSSNFLSKTYNFKFQESALKIVHRNLTRGIELKDKELVQSGFRLMINLYRKALLNRHNENIEEINRIFSNLNNIKNKRLVMIFLKLIKYFNYKLLNWQWNKLVYRINIF